MRVHRHLGPGFREVVYQRALGIELARAKVPFVREFPVPVVYDGHHLGTFRADFLCHGEVIVEIKALPFLGRGAVSQLCHYLRACDKPLGLALNFGSASLEYKRVILPWRSEAAGDSGQSAESGQSDTT